MSESQASLGRFADPALLVLASLAGGAQHGYGITRDVLAMSGVYLGPGTLYGAIARLEQRGWIHSLPAEGRRHPYEITAAGRDYLRSETSGLQKFAETLRRRAAL